MNFRFDVIIVGDSSSGHAILDKLATSKSPIKVAFISKSFKSTTTHDYNNVTYFREEVAYVSYRHRLFCCFTKNGNSIFSTHLIIASGLAYEPFVLNTKQLPYVRNSVDDVTEIAKDQSALIVYNQASDVKFALDIAKKHKQVYLCTKEFDISKSISAAMLKKLNTAENIVVLSNAAINEVVCENSVVQKVTLDNYTDVDCSAIYAKTATKPALDFIPEKMLVRENDYPVVTEYCESTLMPKCFVVGSCLKKYTKTMEQNMIDIILKDF